MKRIIETDRIFLRPFCRDDIKPFAKICANPKVMRYIGDGLPVHRDIIAEKIPEWIELYEKHKYGLMALIIKESHEFIGFCGFIHQTVEGVAYIELGYRLDEVYWGKGIATEAARAVTCYAFNELKLPGLIAIIHHQNHASKRVAMKVGMSFIKQTHFNNVLVDVFYLKKEDVNSSNSLKQERSF
ncbi:TPA: GNAT family N-acetyltransferase [Legionella pneumophila]